MSRVYYAHSIAHKDTRLEERSIALIKERFRGVKLINPNDREHTEPEKKWGMKYFIHLVSTCDIVVAAPFNDGKFGMGVFIELHTANTNGSQLFQITNGRKIEPLDFYKIAPLSIDQTRKRNEAEQLSEGASIQLYDAGLLD